MNERETWEDHQEMEGSDYEGEDDYDDEEDGYKEEDYDELPEELTEGLADAEAFFTCAKKAHAEMEKARGFFKK